MKTAKPVRNFPLTQVMWEQLQAILAPVDWPAALAERLGASTDVAVQQMQLETGVALGSAASLRIAFASDFHAGPMTSDRVLDQAAAALAAEKPDVLLLGGDFVSIRARYVARVVERLTWITAPAGRFAVLGNHDYWAGACTVTRALEQAGIEVLTNLNRRLPPPFENVTVCGLDDHMTGYPDAEQAFADATPIRLLLMHSPSGLLDVGPPPSTIGCARQTHGGPVA